MAITREGNWIRFGAAADVVTELLRATTLVCSSDGTAAGDFIFKDGDGDTMLTVRVPADVGGSASKVIPLNTDLYGLEMDAVPSGGVATLFIK